MIRMKKWQRLMAAAAFVCAISGPSFGSGTGFYRVEKQADGRWRLLDPKGEATFLTGVDHVK
jgi:hypothetical protein